MTTDFRPITRRDLDRIPQLQDLGEEEVLALKAVSAVLPFRVNSYVIERLIDWDDIPDDPIYQLTFPQRGMLSEPALARMMALVRRNAPAHDIKAAARRIQLRMNPHPAGQLGMNVPIRNGQPLRGLQHKYRETVLFFPTQGQTCHAYCTYCFRWPQFVGTQDLKFASKDAHQLIDYLENHPEVTDVLFTGGDPMVMRTSHLERYLEPLLDRKLEHVTSLRIGTKALAYWPYRFTTDGDADDLLRLFQRLRRGGKQVAIMAHFSHPHELRTHAVQMAIRRLRDVGCVIRTQAPLIHHVNDCSNAWADMWRLQLRLGIVPYYMFIERDTGPRDYFAVPIARAFHIFRTAYQRVSGLGRSVRGPSMSTTPGKIVVEGITRVGGEKVFVLNMLQGRNPEWVKRPFFARFDHEARWLDDLVPAFEESRFFFEDELDAMMDDRREASFAALR